MHFAQLMFVYIRRIKRVICFGVCDAVCEIRNSQCDLNDLKSPTDFEKRLLFIDSFAENEQLHVSPVGECYSSILGMCHRCMECRWQGAGISFWCETFLWGISKRGLASGCLLVCDRTASDRVAGCVVQRDTQTHSLSIKRIPKETRFTTSLLAGMPEVIIRPVAGASHT